MPITCRTRANTGIGRKAIPLVPMILQRFKETTWSMCTHRLIIPHGCIEYRTTRGETVEIKQLCIKLSATVGWIWTDGFSRLFLSSPALHNHFQFVFINFFDPLRKKCLKIVHRTRNGMCGNCVIHVFHRRIRLVLENLFGTGQYPYHRL